MGRHISSKPLTLSERQILEKGPKFATTPTTIPYKNIIAEIEAAITFLPNESKEDIRTTTASTLNKAQLPKHQNITKEERKALNNLKKDSTRVIMKADKGNCFVVMDKADYDQKMETMLEDKNTYEKVNKQPFQKIERQMNEKLIQLKKQKRLDDTTYYRLRSVDGLPPSIRGSVKHHKPGYPLRPVVTCIGSTLYNISKYLSDLLSPIQNHNGYSVKNSKQFSKEITDTIIDDDETMVSFDVVSLFTAIPVKKACSYIRRKLERDDTLESRTNLNIDDIISLLDFVLSNNYFIYKGDTYKQIQGCAMGSPVSAVVANLCMEEIEESAIDIAVTKPKLWKRYVDDGYCITKTNAVTEFHNTLNSIDPNITFTIEHENNGTLAFLDTLTSRRNGRISIDVFRKPTHTDRYLDFNSHHDKRHKTSTARTLIHRALTLPNTEEGKCREFEHISKALKSNGYPTKFISTTKNTITSTITTPSPEELVGMFFKQIESSNPRRYAVLPYIKGLTETLQRTLRKHDIDVATKPLRTLQQQFPSPKYRVPVKQQTNVVYKIPCKQCSWTYIGETGRSFETRKKEHIRNLKTHAQGSNIANHSWKHDHAIDFENSQIIDKGNYRIRKSLESWHTAVTKNADNNAKTLPSQYSIITTKQCRA